MWSQPVHLMYCTYPYVARSSFYTYIRLYKAKQDNTPNKSLLCGMHSHFKFKL